MKIQMQRPTDAMESRTPDTDVTLDDDPSATDDQDPCPPSGDHSSKITMWQSAKVQCIVIIAVGEKKNIFNHTNCMLKVKANTTFSYISINTLSHPFHFSIHKCTSLLYS